MLPNRCLSCLTRGLWPNGLMDQDQTWHGGRPQPRPHCVRLGPSSHPPKKGRSPPIFEQCLLWPNGWMDQDVTWRGGRPRPRQYCVRWGPTPIPTPKKGHSSAYHHKNSTWYSPACICYRLGGYELSESFLVVRCVDIMQFKA